MHFHKQQQCGKKSSSGFHENFSLVCMYVPLGKMSDLGRMICDKEHDFETTANRSDTKWNR